MRMRKRVSAWVAWTLLIAFNTVRAVCAPVVTPKPSGRLVFVSDRSGTGRMNIYTMASDGSNPVKVTNGERIDLDPAWSADRKRIAFVGIADAKAQKSDIYTTSPDGTLLKKVVALDTIAFSPTWSPDGKLLAFSKLDSGANKSTLVIMTMSSDGSNQKRLVDGLSPAWSPDGEHILYTILEADTNAPHLYIMDKNGKGQKQLVSGKSGLGAWAPDGKHIAYMASGENHQPHIYVVNSDGSGSKQVIATDGAVDFAPAWSDDGRKLYFTRLEAGVANPSIYSVDINGANPVKLTRGDTVDFLGAAAFFLTSRQVAPTKVGPKK